MGQPPTMGACNVTSYHGSLQGDLLPRKLARWVVGSCLLSLGDAETQSGLGHRASEGHGWQHKERASPTPAATKEGASWGWSWDRVAVSCPEKGAVS